MAYIAMIWAARFLPLGSISSSWRRLERRP